MRWLVLVFVAACGFAPQEEFSGTRPSNGVAAWQDLGGLPLCLGNRRVGPAAAGSGGFCVDVNTPNEAVCSADADCDTRESCVCGRCTASYCSSASECGGGQLCNFSERRCARPCANNAACLGGEICTTGFCKGTCQSTADCQYGEKCSSQGRCVVDECADASGCTGGDLCKVQREARDTSQPSALSGPAAQGEAGDRFVIWFAMGDAPGLRTAIHRATSADGVHFRLDPAAPVLEDGLSARAPSVIAVDDRLVLFYETDEGVKRSESSDGRSFPVGELVFPGDVHAPGAAIGAGGQELVFLQDGERASISLSRGGATPVVVLRPEDVTLPELWRDVDRLGSPFVLVDDALGQPSVRLWFDAFGAESGDSIQFGEVVPLPPNDSIGYATAPLADPGALEPYLYNPVFDRVQAFLTHDIERAPTVVKAFDEETWFLYYDARPADDSRSDGLGVARHPPLVAAE